MMLSRACARPALRSTCTLTASGPRWCNIEIIRCRTSGWAAFPSAFSNPAIPHISYGKIQTDLDGPRFVLGAGVLKIRANILRVKRGRPFPKTPQYNRPLSRRAVGPAGYLYKPSWLSSVASFGSRAVSTSNGLMARQRPTLAAKANAAMSLSLRSQTVRNTIHCNPQGNAQKYTETMCLPVRPGFFVAGVSSLGEQPVGLLPFPVGCGPH